MTTLTTDTMTFQVTTALGARAHEYNIPAIVDHIHQHYGLVDVNRVPAGRFWDIVDQFDITNPCSDGCSDPAAHAEGAHDL